ARDRVAVVAPRGPRRNASQRSGATATGGDVGSAHGNGRNKTVTTRPRPNPNITPIRTNQARSKFSRRLSRSRSYRSRRYLISRCRSFSSTSSMARSPTSPVTPPETRGGARERRPLRHSAWQTRPIPQLRGRRAHAAGGRRVQLHVSFRVEYQCAAVPACVEYAYSVVTVGVNS